LGPEIESYFWRLIQSGWSGRHLANQAEAAFNFIEMIGLSRIVERVDRRLARRSKIIGMDEGHLKQVKNNIFNSGKS